MPDNHTEQPLLPRSCGPDHSFLCPGVTAQGSVPGAELKVSKKVLATDRHTKADTTLEGQGRFCGCCKYTAERH